MNRPVRHDSWQSSRPVGRPLALTAISLGIFMIVLDASIVNVALPAIQRSLHSSLSGLEWIVNAYTLVFAGLLLMAGTLDGRLGARRVFAAGLALFTLASLLCSVAPTVAVLVVARLIQGAGAAAIAPASLALIVGAYPESRLRARAVGIWAGFAGAAFATGPIAGGLLVDSLGWRSIFLVNVPIGVLTLALTLRAAPETARRPDRALDWRGQTTAALSLALLTFALIEGRTLGWRSLPIVCMLAVAAAAAALFVVVERRGEQPMVNLRLFRNPAFVAGNAGGLVFNFGLYSTVFLFSLYLQDHRGYSAIGAGLAFLTMPLLNVPIAALLAGRVVARSGARLPMLLGCGLSGVGTLLLATVALHTSLLQIEAAFVLVGVGTGLLSPAMTATVLANAPAHEAGVASATLNAARQVGGLLGVAIAGALISGDFIAGMRLALLVTAAVFAAGFLLTLICVPSGVAARVDELTAAAAD